MTTTHSASGGLDIVYSELITGTGITSAPGRGGRMREQLRLVTGANVGQINIGYAKTEEAIASSATTVYKLFDGSLKDTEQNSLVFAKLVFLALRNNRPIADAGAYIEFGPAAAEGIAVHADGFSKALTDRARVPVGAGWVWMYSPQGWPIASTLDGLAVDASAIVGDTNGWDIIALGRI